jgi:hypothetical protein
MTLKPLTGLFLGAGASYEAGMPLVWELTSEITNWLTADKIRSLNAGWRTQAGGYSDRVIDDFVGMLNRPSIHYEALLGHLEVQFRRQRDAQSAQEYHGLYSWLVELVSHLLYYRQVNNSNFLKNALPYYDGIKALADANAPLWIFTLNHDLIVELIAARLSIPIHSGFSDTIVNFPRRNLRGKIVGHIRGEMLTEEVLEKHAPYFPNPPKPGIYLLKVHGALDVFACNEGKDLVRLLPSAPTEEAIIDMLRGANEGLFYPISGSLGGKAKATNEIAYADEQGVMQFLRRSLLAGAFKFDPHRQQVLPKSMLKHFKQNINFVTKLVCIGYGFGDIHINSIIREWLELTADRRLEIVTPLDQQLPSFLLHLAPQITIIRRTATDYLDSIAGIERPLRDKLSKRIGARIRSLGQRRAAEKMTSFKQKNGERLAYALAERINGLPLVDSKPDPAAIADPKELGKKWAAELKSTDEQLFERLLQHLDEQEVKEDPSLPYDYARDW